MLIGSLLLVYSRFLLATAAGEPAMTFTSSQIFRWRKLEASPSPLNSLYGLLFCLCQGRERFSNGIHILPASCIYTPPA
ncbi:uncharacterized protein RAG0_13698 [Rhynchosporium agropyri]|uniref:Secreted protein n=1 Tax=Rhynchosporium agropyri TaxID=914238 RepID=A0A1E1LDR1_9HELO|nr:uncharacterized protein RAG0_13698 [Rhynchosporium agropyri]